MWARTSASGKRTLPVVTLDEQVAAHGVERVAFLKIDTEGMELAVLAGATHTLARTSVIALETHERRRHHGVLRILREHGFRIDREEFDGWTGIVFASRRDGIASTFVLPEPCPRDPSLLKRRSL
jgi:hypothetical protein